MVREDIVFGLKNAVERGESLEKAAESMINAGYDFRDVKEAMDSMSPSAQPKKELPALPVIEKREVPQMQALEPVMPAAAAPELPTVRPSAPLPELPKIEAKGKGLKLGFLERMSTKTLITLIGITGFAILCLAIYLFVLIRSA